MRKPSVHQISPHVTAVIAASRLVIKELQGKPITDAQRKLLYALDSYDRVLQIGVLDA